MDDQAPKLNSIHDVVLHNWPTRDVPDTLARAGLGVTVYGGPEPDDISVCEVVDGNIVDRRTGQSPTHTDLLYVFPWPGFELDRDLAHVASNAAALGASILWYQSGRNSDGSTSPDGCWLSDADASVVQSVASTAGLTCVHDAYIADEVRKLQHQA